MVDVKRVTASVKKPKYYFNQGTKVTNEVVNFNPANNPIVPETAATVYTIDPFSIFTQENNALKVKIPFTRFYRIKYAIIISNTYSAATPDTVDQFSVAKPILTVTESIVLKRLSNGVTTQINANVYTQDGTGFLTYDPIMVGDPPTFNDGYNVYKTCTPAIIEGIVELYAGDVLTFEHSRVVYNKSTVTTLYGQYVVEAGYYNPPFPNVPPDEGWTSVTFPLKDYPGIYVTQNYKADASFFFEISEITDL